MTRRSQDVSRCWLLVATWLCLLCFCTAQYIRTTAAHWTLYSGLSLTWNEASMFCKSLGGHLPVLNTKLKWNGFNATAVKWKRDNQLENDVWTGLFTQSSSTPSYWEANCSVQPRGLNFWGPLEPDSMSTDQCVRYKLESRALHTMKCEYLYNIVCEFDNGSCSNSALVPSLNTSLNLHTSVASGSTRDSCWDQCMNDPPMSSGQECVGVEFTSGLCKKYIGDTLVPTTNLTANSSVTTILKQCFHDDVNYSHCSYDYDNNNRTPQPAGDPCSANKPAFVPVVPSSTCVQTSTAASTEPPGSSETTTQTTREQSSAEPKTQTTWPTTEVLTQQDSTVFFTPTVISTSVTTSGSSNPTSSITSSKPLLCPCMKTHTANATLPIMHHNTTSKYRRNHNSEWGSPSTYTSTCSATFVIVVGFAGFLVVACDMNRLIGLFDKKSRRKAKTRSPRQM